LLLTISPLDIQKIAQFVADCQRSDGDIGKVYVTKRNMLVCLKHMIKPSTVYEILKKEADLYAKMRLFCSDGNNLEFNTEAWALFYQVIYCHQGVLDYLIKANTLAPFLQLVGTSSNNIIIFNGLHYITKIFMMLSTEQKLQQEGKPPTRTGEKDLGLKSFEKDAKALNKFFY